MDEPQEQGAAQQVPKVKLCVVCGHLAFASHPVMVGHYDGDTFAGTEARLDQVLDGRLTERREMGLYPGPIGTSLMVLDSNARPPASTTQCRRACGGGGRLCGILRLRSARKSGESSVWEDRCERTVKRAHRRAHL